MKNDNRVNKKILYKINLLRYLLWNFDFERYKNIHIIGNSLSMRYKVMIQIMQEAILLSIQIYGEKEIKFSKKDLILFNSAWEIISNMPDKIIRKVFYNISRVLNTINQLKTLKIP